MDEVVQGTRLLKPGLDAVYATVLDLSWDDAAAVGRQPTVTATFVKCSDYPPDSVLAEGTPTNNHLSNRYTVVMHTP